MLRKRRLCGGTPRLTALVVFGIIASAGLVYAMPSFDGGTEVEFNAEDNATIGYLVNPAKLAYYERSAFLFDVGGDWSIGSLKYDENGGTVEPGTPPRSGRVRGRIEG